MQKSEVGTFTRSLVNPYESLKWRVGLSNEEGKFLTAEPFSYKLNVSGAALKRRQTWILVPDPLQNFVYLKSHLNRFLSADSDGVVTCQTDKPGVEERFLVVYSANGWAFRSAQYGLYFSGRADRLSCFSKTPVWWNCHLALHPQVHVKNLNRGRYLRMHNSEVWADRLNPWGSESLVTLQQLRGRVAVRTSDGKFLTSDGRVVAGVCDSALFSLEIRCGPNSGLAFKDNEGHYLTNVGANGLARTKNLTVNKDELYVLEDSYAQVAVRAFNGRYASIRQGHDVNANQSEIGPTETFQLEFQSGKWRFRTQNDTFWRLTTPGNGITATGDVRDPGCQFSMDYAEGGRVSLQAVNGCRLTSRRLGAIVASVNNNSKNNNNSNNNNEEELFQLVLLNRPVVVFRCDHGYVGIRNSRLECNLVSYEIFRLEWTGEGYKIRGPEGYWNVAADTSVMFNSTRAEIFTFEFRDRSCIAIMGRNGRYMRGEQNGTVRVDCNQPTDACLWEY